MRLSKPVVVSHISDKNSCLSSKDISTISDSSFAQIATTFASLLSIHNIFLSSASGVSIISSDTLQAYTNTLLVNK